jgi:hypothetical protein
MTAALRFDAERAYARIKAARARLFDGTVLTPATERALRQSIAQNARRLRDRGYNVVVPHEPQGASRT